MRKTDERDHSEVEAEYWFVPKMFGFGATPVTWQGWALTLGYVALLLLDLTRMPEQVARIGVAIALSVAFLVIAIRKTKGGWAWHWGSRK